MKNAREARPANGARFDANSEFVARNRGLLDQNLDSALVFTCFRIAFRIRPENGAMRLQ